MTLSNLYFHSSWNSFVDYIFSSISFLKLIHTELSYVLIFVFWINYLLHSFLFVFVFLYVPFYSLELFFAFSFFSNKTLDSFFSNIHICEPAISFVGTFPRKIKTYPQNALHKNVVSQFVTRMWSEGVAMVYHLTRGKTTALPEAQMTQKKKLLTIWFYSCVFIWSSGISKTHLWW